MHEVFYTPLVHVILRSRCSEVTLRLCAMPCAPQMCYYYASQGDYETYASSQPMGKQPLEPHNRPQPSYSTDGFGYLGTGNSMETAGAVNGSNASCSLVGYKGSFCCSGIIHLIQVLGLGLGFRL